MSWTAAIRRESGLSLVQLLGGLIIVLASLAPTWFGGFLLDDTLHLFNISGAAGPPDLTCALDPSKLGLHMPGDVPPGRFGYWRPLTGLSLLIDFQLFGLNPVGYHLTNTLLHLMNVLLAFRLGRHLGLWPRSAWAAALVWGVSLPAGLAVGWVSGRSELLAAVCVLGAHLAAVHMAKRKSTIWLAGCFFLLLAGILAKESAAVGPGLIMLFLLAARRNDPDPEEATSRQLLSGVLLWLPVGLGLGLRLWLAGLPRIPEPYFQPLDSMQALGNLVLKFLIYLTGGVSGLPIIPFIEANYLHDHGWAIGLVVLFLLLGGRAIMRSASFSLGWLLLGWFILGLGPALLVMAFSFYLYLPLLSLCWLLALAWQRERSRWQAGWLAWLALAGILLNLTLGGVLIRLGRCHEAALNSLEAGLVQKKGADVAFLDVPFWAYSLPPAVRLRHPDLAFETHFVNFSPTLVPGTASRLTWIDGRQLELERSSGDFFTAPIEQFFLFGQDPCDRTGSRSPLGISCLEGQPSGVLQVFLDGSATGPDLILYQFQGWQLRQIFPSVSSGASAPPAD